MMKLFLIIFLVFIFQQSDAQHVVINGKFNSTQNVVELEDISAFQYLQPQNEKLKFPTDQVGNFNLRIDIKKPGYFRLGRNILYLTPGDHLKVEINHMNPELSTFQGKGSLANLYLRQTPFPKGGSYLEAGKLIMVTPEASLAAILKKAETRNRTLGALKGISPEFRRLESARTKADVMNSILSFRYYFAKKLKLKEDSATNYLKIFMTKAEPHLKINQSSLIDPSLLQLVVYRELAKNIARDIQPVNKFQQQVLSTIKDWISADSIVKMMVDVDDKKSLVNFRPGIYRIDSKAYRKALQSMLNSLVQYGNGDEAIDFIATNIDGKKVRLSDYKGKIIYIDIWATWCGPCLAEMPAFESLKSRYAENSDIVFLSLSIDENIENWKKNVNQRKASGLQWHIPRSSLKDYQLINIPRTIVIDRDFTIANFKSFAPSSTMNISMIDGLLLQQSTGFIVKGQLSNAPANATLYLSYQKDGEEKRDSAKLSSGMFSFSGKVDAVQKANLLLSYNGIYSLKKNSDQTSIYLGDGQVNLQAIDSIANAQVSGTAENDANQQLKHSIVPLDAALKSLYASLNDQNRKDKQFINSVKQQNVKLNTEIKAVQKAFILLHPQLMVSLDVLKSYAGPIMDISEVQPLFNSLSAKIKQSASGKDFGKGLDTLSKIEIGQMAPDFSMPDTAGKYVSMSSFNGKYVLLDFWASWCGPCRAENPNLVQQYQKFKNKNFTILGVSLDAENAKKSWIKAIMDDQLIWTNVADLKAWKNEAAQLYHVKAIPQNFLIGPDGKILAKNLRGDVLNETLSSIIKE